MKLGKKGEKNLQGWVKFHREWLDNPVIAKDNEHLALWLYLISNACFEPKLVRFGGEFIALSAGEMVVKQTEIAKTTNIDRTKVIRILKMFKNEQLIEQATDCQQTRITIRFWDSYQKEIEQGNAQRVNIECTTEQDRENEKEKRSKREKEKEKEIKKNERMCVIYAKNTFLLKTHGETVLNKSMT